MPAASIPLAYGPTGRSAWLDVDWREHQQWLRVGGRDVNVIDLGEGDRTIVFVHGLAGAWVNWLEQVPGFAAAGNRVIAMDLPGFGASPMPAEKITISDYARVVDALLDELGVDAAAVVGHSMGGFIAAELAIRRPARVERLVLVSAAGLTIEYQRDERVLGVLRALENRLTAYGAWLATRSDTLSRRPRARRLLMGVVAARPDLLPAPLVAEQIRGSGTHGFVDALDALTDYPIRDRLPEIACPTLIVWGEDDKLVPVRDAEEFERLIPDARKVVFPDTGHVAMLERPAAFNELLERFLAEEPNEDVDARRAEEHARAEGEAREAAAPPA